MIRSHRRDRRGAHLGDEPPVHGYQRFAGLRLEEHDGGVVGGDLCVARVERDQLRAQSRAGIGRHEAEEALVLGNGHHHARGLHHLAAGESGQRPLHGGESPPPCAAGLQRRPRPGSFHVSPLPDHRAPVRMMPPIALGRSLDPLSDRPFLGRPRREPTGVRCEVRSSPLEFNPKTPHYFAVTREMPYRQERPEASGCFLLQALFTGARRLPRLPGMVQISHTPVLHGLASCLPSDEMTRLGGGSGRSLHG